MREYKRQWASNKRAAQTEEEKQKSRQINKGYYQKNAEKRKAYARHKYKITYQQNPKKILERNEKWRNANPELSKKINKESAARWLEKNRDAKNRKTNERNKINMEQISDIYLSISLRIPINFIRQHPSLLELKRNQIKTSRLLKTIKNQTNEKTD